MGVLPALAATTHQLNLNPLDYALLAIYFALVIAIGVLARRAIATSEDFLLAGRALPAWITGLAFISANLGAIEILGMAANGAQYGWSTDHFYWIGAVPAMVFLGVIMMPFYYASRARSVPEYLRRRFNNATHLFNTITFAVSTVPQAGVNLYALAIITVFTYDIWQSYVRRDRPDRYYLNVGRIVTVAGVLIGILTAFIASGYSNIMNYLQLLFSFFNAPLFAPASAPASGTRPSSSAAAGAPSAGVAPGSGRGTRPAARCGSDTHRPPAQEMRQHHARARIS